MQFPATRHIVIQTEVEQEANEEIFELFRRSSFYDSNFIHFKTMTNSLRQGKKKHDNEVWLNEFGWCTEKNGRKKNTVE